MNLTDITFTDAFNRLRLDFLYRAQTVHTERWQGADISKKPEMRTEELLNAHIVIPLKGIEDLDHWRKDIKPNLPWADDHFAERTCGEPLNPGKAWEYWPYNKSADKFRTPALGPRLPVQDWAYLAGFLDGEGTIYYRPKALPRWQGVVRVYQKSLPVLQHLFGTFKVGKIVVRGEGEWESTLPDGSPCDNPMCYWQINAINEVRWLLTELLPHLHVKKAKAKEALDVIAGSPINGSWNEDSKKKVWDQEWEPRFNHSYMSRLWPKHLDSGSPMMGHGWTYGDLRDLVELLANEPLTRQAWIPLFFPEDTGRGDGGRKPCTLGYQFFMRNNLLHIYYPLRSCDYVRHMRDDCYLAVRLLLWVLDRCRELNPEVWNTVRPGIYSMHMTSLHIFANDRPMLKQAQERTAI